jgi:transposase-like protein
VVGDLNSGKVVAVRLTHIRTGLDVIALFEGNEILVKNVKDVLHDGGPWYNILSKLRVPHQHVTFGQRNLVEQTFRSFKHSLSGMDRHLPWNASEQSILTWIRAFVNVYNLLR